MKTQTGHALFMFCYPKQTAYNSEEISPIITVICLDNASKATIIIVVTPKKIKFNNFFKRVASFNKDYNHFKSRFFPWQTEKSTEKQELLKWALYYLYLLLISKDSSLRK